MTSESTAIKFGKDLLAALGVPPGGWQQVVVVADVENPVPRVYLKGVVLDDARILATIKAVADGGVTVAELPPAESVR